jgi:DNA-binding NtrC family response regulator/pSer/pThr/pTyr-binding forkhead associated (FHA) protein
MNPYDYVAELLIEKGKQVITTFKVREDDLILTIGRHGSNDINLSGDPKISRTHAAIIRSGRPVGKAGVDNHDAPPVFMLRDLGSAKGTRTGIGFIRKKILEDGDKIAIGDYRITFRRNPSGIDSKKVIPLDQRFDQILEGSVSDKVTVVGAVAAAGFRKEERELIANIFKDVFSPDLVGHPDTFLTALRSVVRAERCIVGFLKNTSVHIEYQKGFERESANCDPEFIARLHVEGRKLQPAAIWIPFSENAFLALFRTKAPAFREEEAHFVNTACEALLKSAPSTNANKISCPWQAAVVGLADCKVRCREIASDEAENNNVLITGETGTGKEVLARFIHDCSRRRGKPFVTASCSALPKELVYSELFGHAKGAFSGAVEAKAGYFEMARGGTLFLDEIGDLPENVQVVLLTALQQREIRRLGDIGDHGPVKTDVRVIAATDRNMEEKMMSGEFRKALRERFPHRLDVPPLRERTHEIPILAYYFFDRYSNHAEAFSRDALDLLRAYTWPGNVRELQNLIKRLVVEDRDIIFSWDLPKEIQHAAKIADYKKQLGRNLKDLEKERIEEVLRETRGNVTEAVKLLGCSRATLYNKMKHYNLKIRREEAP